MNCLLKSFLLLFLLSIARSSFVPKVHVSHVVDDILSGYVESSSVCRLFMNQRSSDDLTTNTAEKEAKYLFSLERNGNFSIHFDLNAIYDRGVIVLYVSCENGQSRGLLNYHLDKKSYSCNTKELSIGDILQTKDSCVYVTLRYKGKGDLYVLNRVSNSHVPTARNIINEGLYLGHHDTEEVSTIICRVFENAKYTLYTTVVENDCIHTPVAKEFITEAFSPEMKWSAASNSIWASQYSGTINHGVHYRRYGGLVYPDSFLKELDVTPEGVLVSSMDEVYSKLNQNRDNDLDDSSINKVVNNNLVWRTISFEHHTFNGLLLVFGKGDVYIYCSTQKSGVSIQDVVTKGKKIGFFEDDAVDIIVEGLAEVEYTIYAVFAYNNQYFGPYPKTVQDK